MTQVENTTDVRVDTTVQNVIDTGPIGGAVDRLAQALAGNAQLGAAAQIAASVAGAQIVAASQDAASSRAVNATSQRDKVQTILSLVILASVLLALFQGRTVPLQVSA